jgi:hypothetical protein
MVAEEEAAVALLDEGEAKEHRHKTLEIARLRSEAYNLEAQLLEDRHSAAFDAEEAEQIAKAEAQIMALKADEDKLMNELHKVKEELAESRISEAEAKAELAALQVHDRQAAKAVADLDHQRLEAEKFEKGSREHEEQMRLLQEKEEEAEQKRKKKQHAAEHQQLEAIEVARAVQAAKAKAMQDVSANLGDMTRERDEARAAFVRVSAELGILQESTAPSPNPATTPVS